MSSRSKHGVVFALGPNIYYWHHGMEAPVLLKTRPREVSSFTLMDGKTLIDGCIDGIVRDTKTDTTLFDYEGEAVIGVNLATRAEANAKSRGYTKLLDKVIDEFKLDPNRIDQNELIITTENNLHTKFYLGDLPLTSASGTRSGISQSLTTANSFFWSNNGHIYNGFQKDKSRRYIGNDFVQMVPTGFMDDYLILSCSDLEIESVQHLRQRGSKNGRIIWTHSWQDYGNIVFAAFYKWPDANDFEEWHLIFGTRDRSKTRQGKDRYLVFRQSVRDFGKTVPTPIFETKLGQPKAYGEANPSIASHRLFGIV